MVLTIIPNKVNLLGVIPNDKTIPVILLIGILLNKSDLYMYNLSKVGILLTILIFIISLNTLIISDTHLTDIFDERKYNFLKKLINECDQLIVNGDFWSSYSCNFQDFISSKWNILFPLMLEKRTIYLFGNHDPEESMDKKMDKFSVEQGYFKDIQFKGHTIHIEHGHNPYNKNQLKILNKLLTRKLHIDSLLRKPLENSFNHFVFDHGLHKYLEPRNNSLKRKLLQNNNRINIVGHTHVAEDDIQHNFLNSGFINYGLAWYVLIDNDIDLKFQIY